MIRLAAPATPSVRASCSVSVASAAEAPRPDRTNESGWSAEGFVDPAYEAERAAVAFDDAGKGSRCGPAA
jgi:hypothetical protein